MKDCDTLSPFWKRRDCPGEYDARHICRACHLKKASEERVEYVIKMDIDTIYDLAYSLK